MAAENDNDTRIGDPIRREVSADSAYIVVPATYTFKQHGRPMIEEAQMTFALRKGADGWKITAWSWTGPRAKPAP